MIDWVREILLTDASAVVTAISIVITFFVGFPALIGRKPSTKDEERMDKVISPLFEAVETYMMERREASDEEIKKILKIINSNKLLVGGGLRYFIPFLENPPKDATYKKEKLNRFVSSVSKEYDRLSATLGIPKRTMKYKVIMYRPRFWGAAIVYPLLQLLVFAFLIVPVMLLATNVDYLMDGASPSTQLVVAVIGLLFIVTAYRKTK